VNPPMTKKTQPDNSIIMSKKAAEKFTGFGARDEFGAHIFKATIPPGRAGNVVLTENYGYLAGYEGTPEFEVRAILPRLKWGKLADAARKDFNARLRARRVPPSTWKPNENILDRMLGKELCVLMWAAELAGEAQLDTICARWTALRPEERWWLYAMTVAEGGLAEDGKRGWRKALYYALSDNGAIGSQEKKKIHVENSIRNSLFG
jgi:hypothetical protein